MNLNSIKSKFRPLAHIVKTRTLVKQSDTPFATHLPILIGVSHFYKISNILEFGSGSNSTIALMNLECFPDVVNITSYENDHDWYLKIKQETSNDERVNLKYFEGSMSECVKTENVRDYDMVFIDDSLTLKERSATIRNVLSKKPKIAIIHDFENSGYRKAVGSKNNTFQFKELLPNTGVYLEDFDIAIMNRINAVIRKHKKSVRPYELQAWKNIFVSENL